MNNGYSGIVNLYPVSHDDYHYYSMDVKQYIEMWKPDLVYNSNDFFTSSIVAEYHKEKKFLFANYGVIDGDDAGKAYSDIIKEIDVPITPSQYGYNIIRQINTNAMYIPHGIDTQVFRPIPDCKKKFGLENYFVFGSSNRNIHRKQYVNILKAFASLKNMGIKDIRFFAICDPRDGMGVDLFAWAKHYGLTIGTSGSYDIVLHPQKGNMLFPLNEGLLAEAYNSWDIHLSASYAEGFGLTTMESQACGVPSVICDNSANTELVKGHGWLYPTLKGSDGEEIFMPSTIGNVTYGYSHPDFGAMKLAMLDAYNHRDMVKEYGAKSYLFAQNYSWSKVLPQWDKLLDKIVPQYHQP